MYLSTICIYRSISSNIWHIISTYLPASLPKYLSNLQYNLSTFTSTYVSITPSEALVLTAISSWLSCVEAPVSCLSFDGVGWCVAIVSCWMLRYDGCQNEGPQASSASKDLWWWDVFGWHVCTVYVYIYIHNYIIHKYIHIQRERERDCVSTCMKMLVACIGSLGNVFPCFFCSLSCSK